MISNVYPLLKTYSSRPEQFFYTILFITARCPSRCPFCFDWVAQENAKKSRELSLENFTTLSKSMNSFFISLTGGEPFLRDDVTEICQAFLNNSQTQVIGLQTGAQYPEKVIKTLEELHESHPDKQVILKLSLDALGKRHDEIRKTPGNFNSFEKVVSFTKELQGRWKNLKLKIVTTVSKENFSEIESIAEYVKNSIGPHYHSLKALHGNPRQPELKLYRDQYNQIRNQILANEQIELNFLSRLYQIFQNKAQREIDRHQDQGKWNISCKAGEKFIVIREDGRVLPCEMKDFSLGNLHDHQYSLRNVLQGKKSDISHNANGCSCDWECGPTFSLPFQKNPLDLIKK